MPCCYLVDDTLLLIYCYGLVKLHIVCIIVMKNSVSCCKLHILLEELLDITLCHESEAESSAPSSITPGGGNFGGVRKER